MQARSKQSPNDSLPKLEAEPFGHKPLVWRPPETEGAIPRKAVIAATAVAPKTKPQTESKSAVAHAPRRTARQAAAMPAKVTAATTTLAATEPAMPESDITPLVALFQAKAIKIYGTVENPLFCAQDVAAYIKDEAHYARIISKYAPEEYVQVREIANARGEMRDAYVLTEYGVYRYLSRSNRPEANKFQLWLYATLKEKRKELIDSRWLAMKIMQTELEESRRANLALRANEERLYRASNNARETVANLTKENARLRRAKERAEDAKYLQSMGRGHLVAEHGNGPEDNSESGTGTDSEAQEEDSEEVLE